MKLKYILKKLNFLLILNLFLNTNSENINTKNDTFIYKENEILNNEIKNYINIEFLINFLKLYLNKNDLNEIGIKNNLIFNIDLLNDFMQKEFFQNGKERWELEKNIKNNNEKETKDIFLNLSRSFKENEQNINIENFNEIIIFGGTFKNMILKISYLLDLIGHKKINSKIIFLTGYREYSKTGDGSLDEIKKSLIDFLNKYNINNEEKINIINNHKESDFSTEENILKSIINLLPNSFKYDIVCEKRDFSKPRASTESTLNNLWNLIKENNNKNKNLLFISSLYFVPSQKACIKRTLLNSNLKLDYKITGKYFNFESILNKNDLNEINNMITKLQRELAGTIYQFKKLFDTLK